MNYKRIIFSSLITAVLGTGIGWVIGRAIPNHYTAEIYQNLGRKYAIVGGSVGLVMGYTQEALRQLKEQREREESDRNSKRKAKR